MESATESMVVCGLLTPQEMNEIFNISALGLSKAGGATVSEAIATNTPLLLIDSYPWKEANATYLIELGLARKYQTDKPLLEQIEEAIINLKPIRTIQTNWQQNILEKIHCLQNEAHDDCSSKEACQCNEHN